MNILLVLPLVSYLAIAQNPSTCVTSISGLQSRVDCGFYGITEHGCQSRGCCWGPLAANQNGPWCFLAPNVANCPSKVTNRVDCGFSGITRDQCVSRGCCWGPLSSAGPWCYKTSSSPVTTVGTSKSTTKSSTSTRTSTTRSSTSTRTSTSRSVSTTTKAVTTTTVSTCPTGLAPSSKVDCGFYDITQSQCLSKGCCWEPNTSNAPWCFQKSNLVVTSSMTTTTTTVSAVPTSTEFAWCPSDMNPENRAACAPNNDITEAQCEALGCCYGNPFRPGPVCYKKTSTMTTIIPAKLPLTCPTIREIEMNAPKPCWRNNVYQNTKELCDFSQCCWVNDRCLFPWNSGLDLTLSQCPADTSKPMDVSLRVDAGYPGITQFDCKDRWGTSWSTDAVGPKCYWIRECFSDGPQGKERKVLWS